MAAGPSTAEVASGHSMRVGQRPAGTGIGQCLAKMSGRSSCDSDTSQVRSAEVLGKTITPTPPGGTAFTGSNGTLGFGFAALFLLMLGSGLTYLGYRRRARFDG